MHASEALRAALRNIPDFPKPGIQFKDITPILGNAALLKLAQEILLEPFRDAGITHVAGIEARGFLLGGLLAQALGVGFVPVRKRGKLPWKTFQAEYALEYGTDVVEIHQDAVPAGARVLIHDDVIATGGTAGAAAALFGQADAHVVGFSFLIELGFLDGRKVVEAHAPVHSAILL